MDNNNLGNIEFNEEDLTMKATTDIFKKSFYFNQFYEDAVFKKFIKSVERTIRTSKEYNDYLGELRSTLLPLTRDAVLGNITGDDAMIEYHHYPLTLYDIVEIVILQKAQEDKKFSSFSIAKEVMDYHFDNIIGLTPLTTTTHQLAHNGDIFINKDQIFGRYDLFLKKYSKGISVDLLDKISIMNKLSEKNLFSDLGGLLDV